MASFYRFQRVRVVGVFLPTVHGHLIGREGYINEVGCGVSNPFGRAAYGYGVAIDGISEGGWAFTADQIEPLRYEPDAADLATREGAPDFTLSPKVLA